MQAHPGYIDGLKGESASLRIQIDHLEAVVAMLGQAALEEMVRSGMCTTEVGYIDEPHKFCEDLRKLVDAYLIERGGHRHEAEQAAKRTEMPTWLRRTSGDNKEASDV